MENKWIKLIDEKPSKNGVYCVLSLMSTDTYTYPVFEERYLLWDDEYGFQPLDFKTNRDSYPINMNVAYWLKYELPKQPKDINSLIVKTQVFFIEKELFQFINENKISIYETFGNAVEVIISNVDNYILNEMDEKFKSNAIYKKVLK